MRSDDYPGCDHCCWRCWGYVVIRSDDCHHRCWRCWGCVAMNIIILARDAGHVIIPVGDAGDA